MKKKNLRKKLETGNIGNWMYVKEVVPQQKKLNENKAKVALGTKLHRC